MVVFMPLEYHAVHVRLERGDPKCINLLLA
jgi:hypothetical protein